MHLAQRKIFWGVVISVSLIACGLVGEIQGSKPFTTALYFKASNPDPGDSFGTAVHLSRDGKTLVVGSPGEGSHSNGVDGDQRDNSIQGSGAVYVFTGFEGSWSQQAYIKASNTRVARFGGSIAVSEDGNTLAVGANIESSGSQGVGGNQNDTNAPAAGAVYIFTRSGNTWSQESYIKASNAE